MREPATRTNQQAALAYVAAHPEPYRLTVADLIDGTGLTRPTLYRAFAEHGGVNEFLTCMRLEQSRELLASGLSCKEVSKRCGFRSLSHFSHRFRSRYGLTATSYQAKHVSEYKQSMS